ncbi:MAG: DnaJ domain-containing protein [Sphingomicrobium sp.]
MSALDSARKSEERPSLGSRPVVPAERGVLNMGQTVRERPSHYDVLGLKPGASADEIARAFAREISIFRPHTLGGIAEVTVAYEVLRNPERRRAYDEAIGVARAAKAAPMTTHGVGGGSFVRAAGPAARPALTLAPTTPADSPAAAATPIVEGLRELARPAPLHDPVPPVAPRPQRAETTSTVPPVELSLSEETDADPGAPMPWKRAGIAAGALALTIALGAAWAGWQSSSAAPPDALKDGALLAPPTTFTVSDSEASVPLPPPTLAKARPAPVKPRARAAARTARPAATSRLAEIEQGLAEPDAAAIEAPAPTAAAAAVPASLPLSRPVIARTIGRIGYPCGSVASTSAVEGGVFTVTCSSGHSYRAAPVRGRYRFRRVTGG